MTDEAPSAPRSSPTGSPRDAVTHKNLRDDAISTRRYIRGAWGFLGLTTVLTAMAAGYNRLLPSLPGLVSTNAGIVERKTAAFLRASALKASLDPGDEFTSAIVPKYGLCDPSKGEPLYQRDKADPRKESADLIRERQIALGVMNSDDPDYRKLRCFRVSPLAAP